MSEHKAVTTLNETNFDELRQTLMESGAPDEAELERTMAWITAVRDGLVSELSTIADEDDLESTLAINYIELKSRWIAMNTQLNYQMFKHGTPSTEVMQRAFSTTFLLVQIEKVLGPEDIEKITDFLSEPISRAA